jgi:hypothetical protein
MKYSLNHVLALAAVTIIAAACQDTEPTRAVATPALSADEAATKQYTQVERLANPLVSEVMVVKARHMLYNQGKPETDRATWTGDLTSFVTTVAGRDANYANTIAGALLPDMLLTYPKRDGTPVFWLSWVFGGYGGRTVSEDAVDIGLGALFGDLLGNTDNVTPGLTTDNVSANDVPFRTSFPYLAAAHR